MLCGPASIAGSPREGDHRVQSLNPRSWRYALDAALARKRATTIRSTLSMTNRGSSPEPPSCYRTVAPATNVKGSRVQQPVKNPRSRSRLRRPGDSGGSGSIPTVASPSLARNVEPASAYAPMVPPLYLSCRGVRNSTRKCASGAGCVSNAAPRGRRHWCLRLSPRMINNSRSSRSEPLVGQVGPFGVGPPDAL